MFEQEISSYAFNITKRYTGERVRLSMLLADVELPEDFKKFAEAEVEELIDAERLGESRTGKIDYSRAEVQAMLKDVRSLIKKSHEFTREEFLELADKASKFIFNYVIRPRWTLEKFLFKGDSEISRESIEAASRFFSSYSYYPKGIIEYLDFHGMNMLDLETWKKIHAKIDEHLLTTLPDKLNNLTWSLFNLFDFASGLDKIPADAMILFFRDKSASEIVDRIEFARDVRSLRSIDSLSLLRILEAPSSDLTQNIAVLPETPEAPKEFHTFERQRVTHPIHPEVPAETPRPEPARREPERTQEQVAQPAAPQFPEQKGAPPERKEKPQISIRKFMTAKLEEKVIKKIFRGSRSAYQIGVHKLDECSDWPSASRVVEGIFIDNEVDPFSKYAVAFTDAVSAKFRTAGNRH